MNRYIRKAIVPIALVAALGVTAVVHADEGSADQSEATGVSAGMAAVDKNTGKLRSPTTEEREALAKGFQKDLARLARKQKKQPQMRTHDNGATSATVGLSKIRYLVVETNEDGSMSYGHAEMDDDGNIVTDSTASLEEM